MVGMVFILVHILPSGIAIQAHGAHVQVHEFKALRVVPGGMRFVQLCLRL